MSSFYLLAGCALCCWSIACAYDGSRDVFHPLIFIAPMMLFIYCYMPWKLLSVNGLAMFFDDEQLVSVQTLNVLGILAFVAACLAVGVRGVRTGMERKAEAT